MKERRYVILDESLKSKSAKKVKYKKTLFDFTKYDSEVKRNHNEACLSFLTKVNMSSLRSPGRNPVNTVNSFLRTRI